MSFFSKNIPFLNAFGAKAKFEILQHTRQQILVYGMHQTGVNLAYGVNIHYEVLGRRGGGWTILDVKKDRDAAITHAENLWKNQQYTGVKVVKETFDKSENEITSVEIFTRGVHARSQSMTKVGLFHRVCHQMISTDQMAGDRFGT